MKTLLQITIVLIVIGLSACKGKKSVLPTLPTMHVTTEQLGKLEIGMNKDQALSNFAGIYPYEILSGTEEGCEIHVYKYWKPKRKVILKNAQLESYLNTGVRYFVNEADAHVFYKDGKIVLVSTEGNKGKFDKVHDVRADDLKACAGPVKGCTDPSSLSYNPDATQDDGSCQYCECGMTRNPDYNPNRPKSDCNQPCVEMDEYGNPLKWAGKGHTKDGEDCSLCDLIKGGENINLNINVVPDGGGSKTNNRTEKLPKSVKAKKADVSRPMKNTPSSSIDQEAPKHVFGFKYGRNKTRGNSDEIETGVVTGRFAGLTYDYLLNKRFTLGADLMFNQLGTGRFLYSSSGIDYYYISTERSHISLPLRAGINLGSSLYGFANLGVTPSFRMNDFSNTDFLDIGSLLELGGGYKFKNGIWMYASLNYQRSLTNRFDPESFSSGLIPVRALTFGLKYAL
jgi:hypothetical protein